jgi:hypothetical protein
MSLALVNTALGRVVAVPCTVAFALFRQRIDRLVTDVAADDLEPMAEELAAALSAARAQAPRPAAASPGGGTLPGAPAPRNTPAQGN